MVTSETQRISPLYVLAVAALAAAISLALYFPTFHNLWSFFDDIDYINVSANVLAGRLPIAAALALPVNEHVAPAFRLLYLIYLRFFGLNVVVWRVMTALVHAVSAVFVAMLAWRYSGKARAGVAAAVTYVTPCGFSSNWAWFPSGAAWPLAFSAFTFASALLAWRDHLRARRIIAGIAVVAALLTWRSFAPMALLPAIIDEIERRREGARSPVGAFSLFCIASVVSIVLIGARLIVMKTDSDIVHGLPRSIFLVLVAPFRFFFPGLSIAGSDSGRSTALLGVTLGITTSAILVALLAALWRRGVPRLAFVAAACAIPPLGLLSIVGLFRFRLTYLDLYDMDRYYFPLLIPIALLAGAIAASISFAGWPRFARAVLTLALAAGVTGEVALHRRAMLRLIPAKGDPIYIRTFAALELLVHHLENAGPIEIPNSELRFPEVYDRIDTAVLTNVISDGKRLRLGSAADAARLNPLLDAWAREIGQTVPFLRVVDGSLVNTHLATTVDFGTAPFDTSIIVGFRGWEKPFRWMGRRGELSTMMASSDLELRLAAPVTDLKQKYPAWTSIPVRVTLVDFESGFSTPLGIIEITEGGIHDYRLPVKPFTSRVGSGRIVVIVLECDHVWKPSEVYGTADTRNRTVQVFSAGTRFPS